jgi:hypothetical protein
MLVVSRVSCPASGHTFKFYVIFNQKNKARQSQILSVITEEVTIPFRLIRFLEARQKILHNLLFAFMGKSGENHNFSRAF